MTTDTAADAARLLAALDAPNGRMRARLALRKAAPDLARAVIRLEAEVERLRALPQPGQVWCMVRPSGKVWSTYPSRETALRAAEILGLGSNAGWHIVCPDGERIDLGPDGRPVKP